jgi:hypothetical protein
MTILVLDVNYKLDSLKDLDQSSLYTDIAEKYDGTHTDAGISAGHRYMGFEFSNIEDATAVFEEFTKIEITSNVRLYEDNDEFGYTNNIKIYVVHGEEK